jgi:hypothetical protein
MRFLSLLLALMVSAASIVPVFAQNPYMDTERQLSSPSGVEHFVYWREYYYATTPGLKGIPYYPDSVLASYAATAAARWNASRPSGNESMYALTTSDNADMLIKYASCPGSPSSFACFSIDSFFNFDTRNVYIWYKATMWVKIGVSGANWSTSSLNGTIAHEMGHAYGLYDQYVNGACNPNRFSIMDGAYIAANGFITLCDTEHLQQWDIDRWREYKLTSVYNFDYYNNWGDGTTTTYWRDRIWNDYVLDAKWYWSNSNNGPWYYVTATTHANYNGSHQNVVQAAGWRTLAWVNLAYYGVHNKYVKVCARAIYSDTIYGSDTCTSFFYPY